MLIVLLLACGPKTPDTSAADGALAPPLVPADRYPDLSKRDVVRVLILGDSGVGGEFVRVAKAAAAECFPANAPARCDLAVLVGDNVYPDGITAPGDQAWIDAFATPMAPFVERAKGPDRFRAWVTAGNHDWAHGTEPENRVRIDAAMATTTHDANHAIGDLWQYPALAYSVPGLPGWLNLHAIDTQLVVGGKGADLLADTKRRMEATSGWDVVFGHHLPASTGGHGQEGEPDDETWAAELEKLRPAGLSLVLAGHDHHQELLVTGGVPVVIQGNSSKGRDVGPSPYSGCSRWVRGGKEARGFAIADFRAKDVTITFYTGDGNIAEIPPATFERSSIPTKGAAIGTCAER